LLLAFLAFPCFFLDAIEEIYNQNPSFPIHPLCTSMCLLPVKIELSREMLMRYLTGVSELKAPKTFSRKARKESKGIGPEHQITTNHFINGETGTRGSSRGSKAPFGPPYKAA
jgi:hypothetical protein